MEKIKYGIIGMGNQGNNYAKAFKEEKITNGVLVAVCEMSEDRLNLAKENFPFAKGFSSYEEMLDSKICDAVIITTPHYDHPKLVIECLKRDIHVICDKPAGVYTKQVREMNEFAKNSKARFAMMFNQRTNCVYRKMREIISGGGIGELQRVNWVITNWFRTQAYYNSGGWRATWAGEGGGVLINQCPHQIDLIQWVVGKMPKTVRGFCQYGRWHDIEVEDEVTAFFEYENGATGVFITTTGEAPGTNRFEISGTKGKLRCEDDKLYWYKNDMDSIEFSNTTESHFGKPKCEIIEVETDLKNPQHVGIIENFTNAILGLEEQFVQGVEGIYGVELMNAIELSGWKNGEKITLPVDEDEYLKELNKRKETSKAKNVTNFKIQDMSDTFGSTIK